MDQDQSYHFSSHIKTNDSDDEQIYTNHVKSSSLKSYDYLLKFLLVGDSDVGKDEILNNLDDDTAADSSFYGSPFAYKATNILLDGKRIRLQLWYVVSLFGLRLS